MDNANYKSQCGQDEYCYENFFKNKKNGTFLEIGCLDGIKYSNTYFFEKLGWNGICVEASPTQFKMLKENRNCICEEYAITNKSNDIVEFTNIIGEADGLSGISTNYHGKGKRRVNRVLRKRNCESQIVNVKTITINDLLEKHNIHNIDLCTIDIEGGEYEVIESIDFKKNKIKILLVENNYGEQRTKSFLETKGYTLVGHAGADEVYKCME